MNSRTWVPMREKRKAAGERIERTSEAIEIAHDGIEAETSRAVRFDFGDRLQWVPRSLIRAWEDNTVTVPEWFAIKKGLV